MTDEDLLQARSAAGAALVERAARHVVALRAGDASLSGIAVGPDLVATAEEALPVEGEVIAATAEGEVAAHALGRDPTTDVALLRLPGAALEPAPLDAAPPAAGALAWAVGRRGGTVVAAAGAVALAGPEWQSMRAGRIDARLELDLRLRPEAEGGLAVDAAGRGLGMAVFGPRGTVLVIPSATLARVVPMLERHGRVPRGWLGLGLQPVRLGRDGRGLLVASVAAGGPGEAAGLREGDIVLAVDGAPATSLRALLATLGPDSVGAVRRLRVLRGGEAFERDLTLGDRPER